MFYCYCHYSIISFCIYRSLLFLCFVILICYLIQKTFGMNRLHDLLEGINWPMWFNWFCKCINLISIWISMVSKGIWLLSVCLHCPPLDTASLHVKICGLSTSYYPHSNFRLIVVSLWLAGCPAKSSGADVYTSHGGGGVGEAYTCDTPVSAFRDACAVCVWLEQAIHSALCSVCHEIEDDATIFKTDWLTCYLW